MRPRSLALFGALALAAPASADTITVNLHDANGGTALAGTAAAVGTGATGSATASGSGQALIANLPAGDYTVTASLPGYAVARKTAVAAGTVVSLDLTRSANKFTALP